MCMDVLITSCSDDGGEAVCMQRELGFTCSNSVMGVGVDEEWGGEI